MKIGESSAFAQDYPIGSIVEFRASRARGCLVKPGALAKVSHHSNDLLHVVWDRKDPRVYGLDIGTPIPTPHIRQADGGYNAIDFKLVALPTDDVPPVEKQKIVKIDYSAITKSIAGR